MLGLQVPLFLQSCFIAVTLSFEHLVLSLTWSPSILCLDVTQIAGDEVPIGSVPGPKKLNPLFFTDGLLPTFKVCMSEVQASRHRPSAASADHSLPLCPDGTWSYTYDFLHVSLILSGFCRPAQPSHTWWCG